MERSLGVEIAMIFRTGPNQPVRPGKLGTGPLTGPINPQKQDFQKPVKKQEASPEPVNPFEPVTVHIHG